MDIPFVAVKQYYFSGCPLSRHKNKSRRKEAFL